MRRLAILGVGCPRCEALARNVEEAARQLGLEYELVRVTDVEEMIEYDVLMTPALAVDGEVKVVGLVPPIDELKRLLA